MDDQQQTPQVAAAVQHGTGERVGHEPSARQLLLAQIAERHPGSADADLARDPRWQQPAGFLRHVIDGITAP